MPAKPSAVLFDLDGTLVDSTFHFLNAVRFVLQTHQRPLSEEESMAMVGHSVSTIYHSLINELLCQSPFLSLSTKSMRTAWCEFKPVGLLRYLGSLKSYSGSVVPTLVLLSQVPGEKTRSRLLAHWE